MAFLLAPQALWAEGAHWAYDGDAGPDAWAALDPANALCAKGAHQSPIDLSGAMHGDVAASAPVWASDTDWTAINNGHTVQAAPAHGGAAGQIEIAGKTYDLVQFHFHHPSEHAVDAAHTEMEVHFVHKAADGALAVIGVMLTGGGAVGPVDAVLAAAPIHEGEAPAGIADPSALLPAGGLFDRYEGSLTTPPCSEAVTWTVTTEKMAVSDEASAAFSAMFPNDARPLQPLNDRELLIN
nr:carbonic anhydrase family protein [Rubellimicrobium rubrum]